MGFNLPVLNRRRRTTRAVSAFTPASLFTAGESGYWLDPSDFTTMWQDSQGVTPVTATGQTCGLILDKRIGTRTQVFDDANVTFGGLAGYAGRVSSGVYQYARDASGNGSVFFGGLTAGRTYLISVQIAAYGGAIPGITFTTADFRNVANVVFRPAAGATGTYTAFYVADGTNFRIVATANGSGGTISNVSILEVPGNHFGQATAARRPILGTEPLVGRRNLLLQTGLTGATSGTPGTAPTGWPFLVSSGTTTVIPGGGSLGGDAIRLSATANRHVYSVTTTTLAASSTYTFSVQCIVHTSLSILSFANLSAPPAGTTLEYLIDGVVVPSGTALPLGPCTVAVRATTSTTAGTSGLRLGIGTGGNVTGDVTFWDPQFELGSTRTAYQRVTDQWNVTQAGVPNVYYLQGDGTDDVITSVAAVPANASTSAQQIFGVRTGATLPVATAFATRVSVASGAAVPSSVPGSMGLRLPHSGNQPIVYISGVNRITLNATTVAAVDTKSVYTLLGDISAPSTTLRRNAAPNGSNTTSMGGGTFTDTIAIILSDSTSSGFFPGRMYQAVMRFGPNLTADQITQTETFVNSKTGAY